MSTKIEIPPQSPASPSYAPYAGEDGEWGVEQGNAVIYDACCGFDEATAKLMAEIMNEGRGLDAWCESDDPNADLLRDRLIERGWVDPQEHNTVLNEPKEHDALRAENTRLTADNAALRAALDDMVLWTDGQRVSCKAETYTELVDTARKALSSPSPSGSAIKLTPLTGQWITRCCVCGREYERGCGSTECCGSIQEIVWHDPKANPSIPARIQRAAQREADGLCAKLHPHRKPLDSTDKP